jgi:hypothetical protein
LFWESYLFAHSCLPYDLYDLIGKLILMQDAHVTRLGDGNHLRAGYSRRQRKLILAKAFQIFS